MASSFARHVRKKGACECGRGIVHHQQRERERGMDQQQQNQDRLFMQYLVLTQAGDARLSKIEARLNALENGYPAADTTATITTQDLLSILILACLLSYILLAKPSSNDDFLPRLDFMPIIKGFLRPVLLWLLDHDEKTWANTD